MAYPRSCNKDASIHVPLPLQTLLLIISAVVVLAASSMLSVAAEPPSGGYRFSLTHVDGHGNFTKDELILRAAERGRRRAAVLRALTTTSHTSGSGEERRHPVHYHDHEYLMDVEVRGHKYRAIVDTGSSLIWMMPPRQQPAEAKSSSPIHSLRDPRVPCDDGLCKPPCKCEKTGCSYRTKYADGFRTRGKMFRETLSFVPPKKKLEGIAIGWSDDDYDFNGMVGLGRGEQSLVEQLHAHTFSYCLATYDKPALKSLLLLDSPNALGSACRKTNDNSCPKVQETPLLENKADPYPSKYYVHLESIKIGDETIYMPKPKEEATTGSPSPSPSPSPNMFIDSGTSFTELEATVYQKLVEHLSKKVLKKDGKKHDSTFCWAGTKDQISRLPEYLELHFTDAVMYLDKDKVMYGDEVVNKDGPKICLAIHEAQDKHTGTSVLGNFQQQNIHMHFDVSNNKLSFVKVDDCTSVK